MAKRFVRTSLATKFRLLFGPTVLVIIAAALLVPWYFMELLAEQGLQRSAELLTDLRLKEWRQCRDSPDPDIRKNASDQSDLVNLYALEDPGQGRKGPLVIELGPDMEPKRNLDVPGGQALEAFRRNSDQETAMIRTEDDRGRIIYRCFRAVREGGRLVAMIDVSMPGAAAGPLVWWTRASFVIGAALAALLASILFAIITERLILRPVRHLRDVADKVAEGDMTVRSTIKTADELQKMGESFNEMLAAITDQHAKLRAANRALDLKLNELAEANVTLFQANKVKSEFLANVSHELRTPLNSIIGFADLLGESADDRIPTGPRVRRYGGNISSSARDLLDMINNLLDLAKIEAGRSEVRLDKVSVTDICQTMISLMTPLADKKQLVLRAKLSGDLPIIVTDGGKLQQILYNLLSNAVKFTPAGGTVTVSTGTGTHRRQDDLIDEVFVSVADTGPGVADVDQQRIFDKFYQVDRTLTKESSGTGLGLAISKELTNLLSGRLTVESSPGRGTTFSLHLPVDGREQKTRPGA